jgi:hypothetical protein
MQGFDGTAVGKNRGFAGRVERRTAVDEQSLSCAVRLLECSGNDAIDSWGFLEFASDSAEEC